ncbi:MAG: recombinase RecT [Clostridia bacterium]|nr:recombinase RecT [Clostridia bacterium]
MDVIKTETKLAPSARFTSLIFREFGQNSLGEPQITDFQRALINNYFICIDRAIKNAEAERLAKNEKNKNHEYDNNLPVNWNTVNMVDLALDLVHYARMGLDMLQPNMLFPIMYKNNKAQKYDFTLMKGYNGIVYIAEKYAVNKPKAVTVEVVYKNDHFKPLKRNFERVTEGYEFDITSPFDRGEIVGGFAYLAFDDPAQNKLIIMSMKDIEKRKPAYASTNFWGGVKRENVNGTWTEVTVEGWKDEMVRKTLIREAYSPKYMPIDPAKVDDAYHAAKLREVRYAEIEAQSEIDEQANRTPIDTTADIIIDDPAPEVESVPELINVDVATGEVSSDPEF